jgi:hypothetical protein
VIDLMVRREVLAKLDGVKPSGGGFMARCPMPDHNDSDPSLSVNPGRDQPVVMFCQGCGAKAPEIAEAAGIDWDLVSNPRPTAHDSNSGDETFILCGWSKDKPYDSRHRKVADYRYRDATGKLIFGVARCALKNNGCKGFRQWRPDPDRPGRRKWNRTLPDGSKVGEGLIYRLPEILDSSANLNVWVVEGEKDADRLWSIGVPATTCPQGGSMGKSKWTPAHSEWLVGRDVMVVADRDETGWAHAESVINSLMGVARSIEIVRAVEGKDISDHLDAGHTLAQLVTVAEPKAPPTLGPDGLDTST